MKNLIFLVIFAMLVSNIFATAPNLSFLRPSFTGGGCTYAQVKCLGVCCDYGCCRGDGPHGVTCCSKDQTQ